MTHSPHDETTLLGPAALGLLTDAEHARLDRHLERCPACRAELDDLSAVVARLGDLNGEQALLEDLRPDAARADAVLVAIAAERRRRDRHTHRGQSALAAAAAVAVLSAGLLSATSLTRDRPPAIPLEPVAVTADAGVDARADVVAHTWGVEIKLVASGLADGRPYTVQVTTDTGEVVSAGGFLGTGTRPLLCNLNTTVLREAAESFVVLDPQGQQVLSAQL